MARMTSLDNWVHRQLTGERTLAKPPGPILLFIVTAAVAVWVCVKRNWWPSPFGAHTWADPLLAHLGRAIVTGREPMEYRFQSEKLVADTGQLAHDASLTGP